MSIGLSVGAGLAIAAGVGAAGAATSGVLGYEGQKGVANASENAAQLQATEAQNALNFQEQEFNTTQANQKPFLQAGQTAVNDLSGLLAPGGSLSQPWTGTFNAPTAAQAAATPGYQFTLQQGQNAIQNSAAAQGNLLSGGTEAALDQYSQGLASTNYQQAFNNALTQYGTSYNTFENNQANQFNRLASVAGLGQTTATQLGSQGQQAANNTSNIDLTAGAQQGQDAVNAASAMASGYNAIGNSANNIGQYAQLASLSGLLAPQSQSITTQAGYIPPTNPDGSNEILGGS
jgi:hypothetical protein